MDEKIVRERRRRKQRQMRRRRLIRMGTCAAAVIVALVFVVRGVIIPIVNSIGGKGGGTTVEEVQMEAPMANPEAAVRQPLRGQGDLGKVTQITPGWHDDENGRWYRNADGTYFSSGFQEVDGSIYCFDDHGYMETGWVTKGAQDYYFNEDGSYNPDKKRPLLALTFDDGPGQYTETLLECLKENNAHATFFMLGQNVEAFPDIPGKILEAGCELGNHSWDHPDLTTLSLENVASQFSRTDDALISACGQAATVARAPYGSWTQDIIDTVGKPFFFWSLDSLDWSYKDVEKDYDSVMNGDLTDGSVILMHDIHEPTVQASLRIIPELVSMGYKLVTVSEMAAAKGVTLQNANYIDFWESALSNGDVAGYDPDFASSPIPGADVFDDGYEEEGDVSDGENSGEEGSGEDNSGGEDSSEGGDFSDDGSSDGGGDISDGE